MNVKLEIGVEGGNQGRHGGPARSRVAGGAAMALDRAGSGGGSGEQGVKMGRK